MASDAFVTLNHLERLQISVETHLDISGISKLFNSLNKSLIDVLQFEGNDWNLLPTNIFDPLTGSNLSKYHLTVTIWQMLIPQFFDHSTELKRVYCRKNKVVNIIIDEVGFRTVDLTSNNIHSIQYFCNEEKSLARRLRVFTMNDNAIRFLGPFSFKCLDHFEELL
ncbi:unnamed protein product [Mytilus coruscus]|uniref:Uncharacterized protein n=1 Tax=Mytilus coruscus TaxID=42192 RepID=A0A6J8D076_MYTCO|nr:unnamed protein product [Mytilus coruscus]